MSLKKETEEKGAAKLILMRAAEEDKQHSSPYIPRPWLLRRLH